MQNQTKIPLIGCSSSIAHRPADAAWYHFSNLFSDSQKFEAVPAPYG